MKIAFYLSEYGDNWDKLIGLWTKSKYSHCELLFSSGVSFSSSPRDGGTRFKNIVYDNHWDIYDLYNINENLVLGFCYDKVGLEYDWVGMLTTQLLGLRYPNNEKWFCSEIDFVALKCGGLKDDTWQTRVHPQRLYDILVKNNHIIGR